MCIWNIFIFRRVAQILLFQWNSQLYLFNSAGWGHWDGVLCEMTWRENNTGRQIIAFAKYVFINVMFTPIFNIWHHLGTVKQNNIYELMVTININNPPKVVHETHDALIFTGKCNSLFQKKSIDEINKIHQCGYFEVFRSRGPCVGWTCSILCDTPDEYIHSLLNSGHPPRLWIMNNSR